jgi:multidrug transporter EmrE-like cation transporter
MALEYGALLGMVLLTTFGQVMLKKGAGLIVTDRGLPALIRSFVNPGLAWGLAASLVAPVLYFFALTRLDLAVAYSFNGLTFALVFLAGRFILGEKGHPAQAVGVLLIVAGVVVFNT